MPDSYFRNEVNLVRMVEHKRTKRQVTMVRGCFVCEYLIAMREPRYQEEKEGKIGNISW
jgi:hypothetical protein